MGSPVSRVTDLAFCPADSHGCPACPHPVLGPGVSGSPDLLVNGQAVLRLGDRGTHTLCCAANRWVVAEGSSSVFVNNLPVARVGDETRHCGGVGTLVTGDNSLEIGGGSVKLGEAGLLTRILAVAYLNPAPPPATGKGLAAELAQKAYDQYLQDKSKSPWYSENYLCNRFVADAYKQAGLAYPTESYVDPWDPRTWDNKDIPPLAKDMYSADKYTDKLTWSQDSADAGVGTLVFWEGHSAIITGQDSEGNWLVTYAGAGAGEDMYGMNQLPLNDSALAPFGTPIFRNPK